MLQPLQRAPRGLRADVDEPSHARGAAGIGVQAGVVVGRHAGRPLGEARGDAALRYLLTSPADGSACKRMLLYLRWMIRGPDAVDLGLWRGVPPSARTGAFSRSASDSTNPRPRMKNSTPFLIVFW